MWCSRTVRAFLSETLSKRTTANMTPSEAEVPTLELGDIVLHKYRVEHRLGQGGMGYVLAVRHIELGELFAMKVLLKSALARPGAADRFLREARSAARLKSDHVVRVYDIGKLETDEPYILMEHLRGKDLADVLEEKGTLPAREVVDFMLEALDALAEAHALGVVHRDLKPSNLFIAARRDDLPALRVLDFGISKELNAKDQAMTHSASLMGSPYYMSPEHMRSAKHVGPATDIWSLGIIMFELLTGRIPFEGETPTEVCARVLEMEVPSILELAPNTPAALVEIVGRCLRRPPEERYSAVELQHALAEVSVALGDVPRSLLSSGSWLKARISLSGITNPGSGTTSDPAARSRANLETIDPPQPMSASDALRVASLSPVKVSQPPSIQGWSQAPPPARRFSSLYLVLGVAAACAGAWALFYTRGSKHEEQGERSSVPVVQVSTEPASAAAVAESNPSSPSGSVAVATAPTPEVSASTSARASVSKPAKPASPVTVHPNAQGGAVKAADPPPPDTAIPTLKRPKF